MDKERAIQEMLNGKKARRKTWIGSTFIFFHKGFFRHSCGFAYDINNPDDNKSDWEVTPWLTAAKFTTTVEPADSGVNGGKIVGPELISLIGKLVRVTVKELDE